MKLGVELFNTRNSLDYIFVPKKKKYKSYDLYFYVGHNKKH